MSSFEQIEGKVQPYQWGGFEFIPTLLSQPSTSDTPSAEYWLGSHPSAPSTIKNNGLSIVDHLQKNAAPPLQFLFKILDVKEMLSIQSHPTAQQAESGFEKENKLGIPLTAKNRNYKDKCHKPELMVALSPFWLLHGIKSLVEIEKALSQKPYLKALLTVLREKGLMPAFELALDLKNEKVIEAHAHLLEEFSNSAKTYDKSSIEFWIHRWVTLNPNSLNGILTLFFLNLVKLESGDAIYQPPGLLHAYLEGQNVELMANSDNVLRAGLTPKHIDVGELLSTCTISSSSPLDFTIKTKLLANKAIEYTTPFEDFQLEAFSSLRANTIEWRADQSEILFCYSGSAIIEDKHGNKTPLKQGETLLILPGNTLTAQLSNATLYKAKNT